MSVLIEDGPLSGEEIRDALVGRLLGEPAMHVIRELGVCGGAARVDLVAIGDCFRGYEIKSDRDSVRRLSDQAGIYGRVMEEMVLICGPTLLSRAAALVPSWWGIELVRRSGVQVAFETIREASPNPDPEAAAVVQLLWREEALRVCGELGVDRGLTTKPCRQIWERLVQEVGDAAGVLAIVRERLRRREGWPGRDGVLTHGFMF